MPKKTTPDVLKLNWERGGSFVKLSQKEVESALADYTSHKLSSFELLSKGCMNTNYKITLSNNTTVVLRVYTRDPGCLSREHSVHELIQEKVPVPRFLHRNKDNQIIPHPFAIIEYAEGILFRDLILEGPQKAIDSCSYQAGMILTQMASFQFKEAGFFEDDLKIKPFEKEDFFNYIASALSNPHIVDYFGQELTKKLLTSIEKYHPIINEISQHKNLTHADYDPANILVKKGNNEWQISAILDWEFALSSTYYMDIGLMLRFAHHLPSPFQNSFIQGIHEANPSLLAPDWEIRAKLVDLLSLLSLCLSNSPHSRPRMFKNIKELLIHTSQVI